MKKTNGSRKVQIKIWESHEKVVEFHLIFRVGTLL